MRKSIFNEIDFFVGAFVTKNKNAKSIIKCMKAYKIFLFLKKIYLNFWKIYNA